MLGECVDAVRYEGNACDRCTAGCETPPVSLVGMTAGMHCGAVTVVTPPQLSDVCLSVESLYEVTLSLSLSEMLTMCYQSFHVPIACRETA